MARHSESAAGHAYVKPRLPVAVWTITTIEAERYFEWQNTGPGVKTEAGHRIEASRRGASRVTLSLNWNGPLAPVIRLFYGKL